MDFKNEVTTTASQLKVSRNQVPTIVRRKGGRPLVCLSVSSAPMARIAEAYCDLILVGDSLGMVVYGMRDTLSVNMAMMIAHGRAVVDATEAPLIVVDMPFGSFEASHEEAFKNSAELLRSTGAQAIKLEGGLEMAETIKFLVQRGIPIMGHVGLMPQRKNSFGGFKTQGTSKAAEQVILQDAQAVADAGCFAIVVEAVMEEVANEITKQIPVPIIGIGASNVCDGQILVAEDMIGISTSRAPKFVKRYCQVHEMIDKAFSTYADEVHERAFPSSQHVHSKIKKIHG